MSLPDPLHLLDIVERTSSVTNQHLSPLQVQQEIEEQQKRLAQLQKQQKQQQEEEEQKKEQQQAPATTTITLNPAEPPAYDQKPQHEQQQQQQHLRFSVQQEANNSGQIKSHLVPSVTTTDLGSRNGRGRYSAPPPPPGGGGDGDPLMNGRRRRGSSVRRSIQAGRQSFKSMDIGRNSVFYYSTSNFS